MKNCLVIDTSFDYLAVALIDDNSVRFSRQILCPKHQSEQVFGEIITLCKQSGIEFSQFNEIVITRGPGSYTGVRIAMTIAKVLCTVVPAIHCYTISTLQAIAGKQTCFSFIDARSRRIYGAYLDDGVIVEEAIYPLDYLGQIESKLVGHLHLLDQPDNVGQIAENICSLRNQWVPVDNIDQLIPTYLKEQSEYGNSSV